MGHKEAQGRSNQKNMSAVYKHTKRDMESLEKYMNNIQGDSLEKDQSFMEGVVNKRIMMREGTIHASERRVEENTLESQINEIIGPVKKEREKKPVRASNLSSLRLSPSAK